MTHTTSITNMSHSSVGGGDIGELGALLMSMREEHDEMVVHKEAARNGKTRKGEEKEEACR